MKKFILVKLSVFWKRQVPFHFYRLLLVVFKFIVVYFLSSCTTHFPEKIILPANSSFQETVYTDSPVLTEKTGLNEYVRYALLNNSELKLAYYKFLSASERAYLSGTLGEPQMNYEYFIQQTYNKYNISLTQIIPGWDKLKLENKRGHAEAMSALYGFEAERLGVIRRVGEAFYEYFYLMRAIELTQWNYQVLVGLEESLKTKYRVGEVQFSALTELQIERDKILNELKTLNDKRTVLSANFASALNIPTNHIIPFYGGELPTLTFLLSIDQNELLELAIKTNPKVKMSQSMLESAEYGMKIAKRSFFPDLMLGANFMAMPDMPSGTTDYDTSVMVGITAPVWWHKNFATIRNAQAVLQAKRQEYTNVINSIKIELAMHIFGYRDSERRIGLFRDTFIPKAKQIYEVSCQNFLSGKVGFMKLIDAYRTLLNFELMLERARVDRELALLGIYSCGIPLGWELSNVAQESAENK